MEQIEKQIENAMKELLEVAKLEKGDIFVVGCSTSEVIGEKIGTASNEEIAQTLYKAIKRILDEKQIYLAVQCCEHLNRAKVIEKELAKRERLNIVNAIPQLHAGGAFAKEAYQDMKEPVLVEHIQADAGLDIGGTLIGMNLKEVAIPVRLKERKIGEAMLLAARTRAKYIGGQRAKYDEKLM